MAEAAAKAGITTMVGFNYIKNPVQALARRLIEDGEIGTVTYYRGLFKLRLPRPPRHPALVAQRQGAGPVPG